MLSCVRMRHGYLPWLLHCVECPTHPTGELLQATSAGDQDRQSAPALQDARGELATVQLGHQDVGEQQGDLGMRIEKAQSRRRHTIPVPRRACPGRRALARPRAATRPRLRPRLRQGARRPTGHPSPAATRRRRRSRAAPAHRPRPATSAPGVRGPVPQPVARRKASRTGRPAANHAIAARSSLPGVIRLCSSTDAEDKMALDHYRDDSTGTRDHCRDGNNPHAPPGRDPIASRATFLRSIFPKSILF